MFFYQVVRGVWCRIHRVKVVEVGSVNATSCQGQWKRNTIEDRVYRTFDLWQREDRQEKSRLATSIAFFGVFQLAWVLNFIGNGMRMAVTRRKPKYVSCNLDKILIRGKLTPTFDGGLQRVGR